MSLAERVYEALPVPAQNAALTGFGLHYRWFRLGGPFDRYTAEFTARERWSADQLGAYCQARLREIVRIAYAETPYYRERWTAAGIEAGDLQALTIEGLAGLPLTPKDDVRAMPERLVSEAARKGRRLIPTVTSGSTGTPTTIYVTADLTRCFMAAREARSFGWAGVSVRLPRSTMGARMIVPRPDSPAPFYRYNRAERQVYLSAYHLSPENVAGYVEGLDRYRPQVLTGFAHSHYLLARLMSEAGLRLSYRPLAAVLGSEKVWPHMRAVISEVLGTPVFEEYGSVENCVLATECAAGSLHVSPDFGLLEVLDGEGRPAPPGSPGRLVCTGLLNDVQPLVRYEIGDVGAWAPGRCPCGRDHLPVLTSVDGRQNDVIRTPDGRAVCGCDEVFGAADHIIEGQLVQEAPGRFTVKIVPAEGFEAVEKQRVVDALKKRLGEVDVEFEVVEAIERSAAGKFRPVVSRLAGADLTVPVCGSGPEPEGR